MEREGESNVQVCAYQSTVAIPGCWLLLLCLHCLAEAFLDSVHTCEPCVI